MAANEDIRSNVAAHYSCFGFIAVLRGFFRTSAVKVGMDGRPLTGPTPPDFQIGAYLGIIFATLMLEIRLGIHFVSEYLDHEKTFPMINPWFISSAGILILLGLTFYLLLHIREVGGRAIPLRWTLTLLAAESLLLSSNALQPDSALSVSLLILYLNCQFTVFPRAAATSVLIGAVYGIQAFLQGNVWQLRIFIGAAAVLNAFAFLLDSALATARIQEDELNQARWAATKFANLNLDIQKNIFSKEESIMVKEKKRIAHEIHDTVGHALTSALYQIRSLKRELLEHDRFDPALLDETEGIVAKAMSDMRKEVYSLRDAEAVEFAWPVRWRKICLVFSECTGVRIRLDLPENLDPIPELIGENILHVIQESLTNAIRHGRATYIDVTFKYGAPDRKLLLRISDNGIGAYKLKVGVGLSGIRERIAKIGGEVAWQTEPNRGFDLGIEVRL